MKIVLKWKTKTDEIDIEMKGLFFIPLIQLTNKPHDFIRQYIKCGKLLDKLKIKEYYIPEHLKDEKQKYESIDATIEKLIRNEKK